MTDGYDGDDYVAFSDGQNHAYFNTMTMCPIGFKRICLVYEFNSYLEAYQQACDQLLLDNGSISEE